MVDDKAPADFGAGVDFNTSPKPAPLGHSPGQETAVVGIQPVGNAVVDGGVDAGVEEEYLQLTPGGGVAGLIGGQGLDQMQCGSPRTRWGEKTPPSPLGERGDHHRGSTLFYHLKGG